MHTVPSHAAAISVSGKRRPGGFPDSEAQISVCRSRYLDLVKSFSN